jgi:hypothetical protein
MSSPPIISEEDRQNIQSDNYLQRYHACENALKVNNVPKYIYQLRRIFSLIKTAKDQPTEAERALFARAVTELEHYVRSHNKEVDFERLSGTPELNELFLDECYSYESLTHEIVLKFMQHGADLNYRDPNGLKPFQYASRSNNVDINREFLTRGADVNEKCSPESNNTIWTNNHSVVYEKVSDL